MCLRKTLLSLVLVCCMLLMSSCGGSQSEAGGNSSNDFFSPSQESGVGNNSTPSDKEKEKKNYRFMVVRDYDVDDQHYEGRSEYEYNSLGKVIGRMEYDENNLLVRQDKYEYDSSGNKTRYECYKLYYGEWELNDWEDCIYDSNNRVIQKTVDDYGSPKTIKYEYDAQGHIVKETSCNSDGSVFSWFEHTYDSAGNEVKVTSYSGNDTKPYGWTEREYDQYGEPTAETTRIQLTVDGKQYDETSGYKWTYERDQDGRITKKIEDPFPRVASGKVYCPSIEEYSYDSSGNKIEYKKYLIVPEEAGPVDGIKSEYNVNGVLREVRLQRDEKNEYDSYGRIIHKEARGYGSIWASYMRDYEYISDEMLSSSRKTTFEFTKSGEFNFPEEDQLFFEELEKTHIEPFLNGYTIYKRFIYLTGRTCYGYPEYGVKYMYHKGEFVLTLELCPMTRMSWDVTRIADNLVYEFAETYSDYVGTLAIYENTVGFSKLQP